MNWSSGRCKNLDPENAECGGRVLKEYLGMATMKVDDLEPANLRNNIVRICGERTEMLKIASKI
jgi:hypothetical protein